MITPHCKTSLGVNDHGMMELRVTSKRQQRKCYCKDGELSKEGVNKDQSEMGKMIWRKDI